jgi:hypothetical protein
MHPTPPTTEGWRRPRPPRRRDESAIYDALALHGVVLELAVEENEPGLRVHHHAHRAPAHHGPGHRELQADQQDEADGGLGHGAALAEGGRGGRAAGRD